jgi:hypothetical protein
MPPPTCPYCGLLNMRGNAHRCAPARSAAGEDPYRYLRLPPKNGGGYLSALRTAIEAGLAPTEKVRIVVSDVRVRPLSRRPRIVAVTSERLLVFPQPADTPIASFRLTDLAVQDPDLDGVAVRDETTGTVMRLHGRDGGAVLVLGWTIHEAVFGPSPGGRLDDEAAIGTCTYLGGHNLELTVREAYVIAFDGAALVVRDTTGKERQRFALADMVALEFSGPGAHTTGGGFIGGGFGLEGAATGMLAAGVLNALTTQHKVLTIVRMETATAQGFFSHEVHTPEALQIRLSAVLATIKHAARDAQAASTDSTMDRLERLATLNRDGALSEDEFRAAKARLLEKL